MLGLRDCFTLAGTKLRTRRTRLVVTLVVSGLMFATMVSGSLVARGVGQSVASFNQEGLVSRFFVQIFLPFHLEYLTNRLYIDRALKIQEERLVKQATEAKRLGIPFDSKSEPKPTRESLYQKGKQELVVTHPAARQAILELAPKAPVYEDLTKLLRQEGITHSYTSRFVNNQSLLTSQDSSGPPVEMTPVVNGAEVTTAENIYTPTVDGSLSAFSASLQTMDEAMLRPFLLSGARLGTPRDGDMVPVIAPYDAAERLLGLKPLSKQATALDKLNRLKSVRTGIKDYVMTVCYRNSAEIIRRQQARDYQQQVTAHRGDSTWTPPELIYAEAAQPCQPVAVQTDKRSVEVRQAEAKLAAFQSEFYPKDPPQAAILKFRIVGIIPQTTVGNSQATTLESLIGSFLSSTLGDGWFISAQAADHQPLLSQLLHDPLNPILEGGPVFAEFPSRDKQRAFIKDHQCTTLGSPEDQVKCAARRHYAMDQFGNPLAAVYDAQPFFDQWFRVLALIVAGLSAVVMMGTIGRIIADSRKETSVFRALGAKRLDMSQVYLLYTVLLSVLVFATAMLLGALTPAYLESQYSDDMSLQAVLAYNSTDFAKHFGLMKFDVGDMLLICLFVVATGLVAAILPLLTNMRRNPIKDMREE